MEIKRSLLWGIIMCLSVGGCSMFSLNEQPMTKQENMLAITELTLPTKHKQWCLLKFNIDTNYDMGILFPVIQHEMTPDIIYQYGILVYDVHHAKHLVGQLNEDTATVFFSPEKVSLPQTSVDIFRAYPIEKSNSFFKNSGEILTPRSHQGYGFGKGGSAVLYKLKGQRYGHAGLLVPLTNTYSMSADHFLDGCVLVKDAMQIRLDATTFIWIVPADKINDYDDDVFGLKVWLTGYDTEIFRDTPLEKCLPKETQQVRP